MSPNRTAVPASKLAFPLALVVAFALALPIPGCSAAPSSLSSTTSPGLAPVATAHTFAQVRKGTVTSTLLVIARTDASVTAIDLSELAGLYSADAFDVIDRFGVAQLDALAGEKSRTQTHPLGRLLGVGPRGVAHIAAGTNYPEHGKEVGVEEAFLFPKISSASGPRSKLVAAPGALMDYEVEVCARFDRELRSVADFDEARKGFFLCGDFSDRATLVRNINLKDVTSGDGFPDAKSGSDRFPVGPFLVVPKDWKAFLAGVVIETHVDGERRQHANAGDMIKDLRMIVQETLAQAKKRTWSYQGGRIPMVDRPAIATGTAVLTGTGEGVVFKEPGPDVINALISATDRAQQRGVIEKYLAAEIAKGIYLRPGNAVRYSSNYLGWIDTDVISATPSAAIHPALPGDIPTTFVAQSSSCMRPLAFPQSTPCQEMQ
ncbi:fumarylacetoacetate hydrolase family protein [Pseudomonas sp. GD03842]|uniref:fumarylacetoacetate hydrolase family protein n=1 Tax=Pseudomonas sp. GD03842 TaxID=2975385 RepID=UPI00244B0351|nr:fumarylacetoacetate hydrolase family protein [Pseudomonas sp. GD03842]MDH0746964.1 fumarylacetoacetate hydrolase family protein [Pseudomonas sp. GD03842]